MSNSIDSFITGFRGGTRKNRYKVTGNLPGAAESNAKLAFHVLSASLPSSTLGIVNFPYRGRQIPYVGDRIYEPWQIMVLDDRGSGLYKGFQAWSELINNHETNEHNYDDDDSWMGDANPTNHAIQDSSWYIEQLDLNGTSIKKVTLRSCWPGQISPLQFDMNSSAFNTFAVSLNYNYIEIDAIN